MASDSKSPSPDRSDASGEETRRSIASLRSKFESLAAGNDAVHITGHHKAASVASMSSTRDGALSIPSDIDKDAVKPVIPPKLSVSRPASTRPVSPRPVSADVAARAPPGRPVTPKPVLKGYTPNDPFVTSQADSDGHLKAVERAAVISVPAPAHVADQINEPTSPIPPSRRPAPPLPSKASSATSVQSLNVTPAESRSGSEGEPDLEPVMSVKALREKFILAEESGQPDAPKAANVPPAAKPAPVIKRIGADGVMGDVPLSPSPSQTESPPSNGTHLPPALPLYTRQPSPPISRTSSPVPPPVNRFNKPVPVPATTTSDVMSPQEITPENTASLSSPSVPATRPAIPSRSSSNNPTSDIVPPRLPMRRPTIVSPDLLEPNTSSVGTLPTLSSEGNLYTVWDSSAPPPLPDRSRASTISRAEDATVASVPGPPPPRLPARHATLPGSVGIPSPGATPPAPPAHPSSPSRTRTDSGTLPPPPLRSAVLSASTVAASSPPRRSKSISHHRQSISDSVSQPAVARTLIKEEELTEVYSEDEDDEPEDPSLAGISAQAKRMLEDYPDTTQANRKAPAFVPDVRIKDCHHVSAFAVFGRYVCTGAHHVRVYDTQLSDHAISVVDLKETGLEIKGKDPKVTAMCFRPGATKQEEGRYLWSGTKDGHLWELDITTGVVSGTKAFAHSAPICNIWRHRQHILSLDETGKLLVFDVGTTEGDTPKLMRTLRIGEKYSFVKMLCGKLWTSSGPLTRSTTSAATSRGPTIRIYDPCAIGTMPPAKSLFTTEWTGTVTAATYMPLSHSTIYLGHEGGFVSVWNGDSLSCEGVLKISNTDVLALEGVGEYLWMGNRKGQLWVFDVSVKPWRTTNIWVGHAENPVQTLMVDPYSIPYSGRYTCWSFSKESLRAWDGLLSVDWIDKQLSLRQEEYCDFRPKNLLICTWNIDSARPTDLSGSEANRTFLDDLLHSVDSPDIIVFGFQEVIPLTDKKYTAKTLLFGNKSKDGGSAGDRVSHAYRHWTEKLTASVKSALPSESYVKIHSESLVGLFTCIFVKSSEKSVLRDLDITTVKRGIGGIYGNKGAIVSRFVIDDTSVCFINVHLAAGQSQKTARNADLAGIMEDKAIFPPAEELPFVNGGCGTGILDHEMVFLNGDLNYRIDQRRENVISSIANNELPYLLEHDQLRKEMRTNHAFRLRSFEEPPITFKPTYKYNPGTQDYDSSEKRRIPAWCDRILYNKSPRIKTLNYQRYEPTVSDHRPVSASFTITIKSIDTLRLLEIRRAIAGEWAVKEKELLKTMGEMFDAIV